MSDQSFQGVDCFRCGVSYFGVEMMVYVYWVDGMLVDSGPPRLWREIGEFCSSRRLDSIVHTHYHEDHTGNSRYLSDRYNVPVFIAPSSITYCRQRARMPLYRRVYWGRREGFAPLPLPETFEAGKTRWEVIPTPGHSEDHVIFLDQDQGRVFTGDLYVQDRITVSRRRENLPALIESLRRLLARDFDTVFCSHSGVIKNGRQKIQLKLDQLEEVRGQVLHLQSLGLGAKEINQRMYPKRPSITFFSGGEFSTYYTVRAFIEEGL
ncbi:MAG: MBL fold metallo-hydrolase [Firmicutes bacterium]|nr:MBL fold metallo-hydrolase [Bacillota bacterium]